MATLLINKAFVASKLQVAIGYSDQDFQAFINEAQEFDLKPLVPEEFYVDMLTYKNDAIWQKVINGGDYDYMGRTYHFQGIAIVIAYYAYARFVMNSGAVSTSFGMVVKTTPNSTPLSLEERKNFYYKKKSEAGYLFTDIKSFIERNIADYPSWDVGLKNCSPRVFEGKTKVIN